MKTFTHLTNPEFLSEIDDVRNQSPIIKELCRRLEEMEPAPQISSCECPVCMADLRAEYDETTEILELKVNV